MFFEDISYKELWQLCNFGRGHYGEHTCEIILTLDHWFRKRCHLKKKFTGDGQMQEGGRQDERLMKTGHNSPP